MEMNRKLFREITKGLLPTASEPISTMTVEEEEVFMQRIEEACIWWSETVEGGGRDYAEVMGALMDYKLTVVDAPTLVPAEITMILMVALELAKGAEVERGADYIGLATEKFRRWCETSKAIRDVDLYAAEFHMAHAVERLFEQLLLTLELERRARETGGMRILTETHLVDMTRAQGEIALLLNGMNPSNN